MRLVPGTVVCWEGQEWIVADLQGLESAELEAIANSSRAVAPVTELQPRRTYRIERNLQEIHELEWRDALQILDALRPVLSAQRHEKKQAIEAAAARLQKSTVAIYKYLQKWTQHRRASAFLRKQRSDKGTRKLAEETIDAIEQVISDFYTKPERPSITETWYEIRSKCLKTETIAPSLSTVVRMIKQQDPRRIMTGRFGPKAAKEKYEPLRGSFPDASFPLAVVQIDHTPIDIILVDERDRKPIGRGYLTSVIDVCTRVVVGFCVSLDAPGSLAAALAVAHAVLPKDKWLDERGLEAPWPVWGIPRKIHTDNGKDFRGIALTRGCAEHDIILEHRPKGQPQYGGHVESSMRTFMKATQRLKGTTFSNVIQKLDYDSEGKAVMTMAEYERWLTIFITYRYHHKKHRSTGYPPIKLYEKHLAGDNEYPGIGLPPLIANPRRLMLDFFPHFQPTVQVSGIVRDHIHYWDDQLRRRVVERDPKDPTKSRKFTVAFDPRDLSRIYFFDPDLNDYIEIPYSDRSRPPISDWELRAVTNEINKDPQRKPNEDMIFEGIRLMREQEESAEKETKKARRERSKRTTRNNSSFKPSNVASESLLPIAPAAPIPSSAHSSDEDDEDPQWLEII
ncbi:MAG: DDE-type integrase/transposase/recombinase [Aquabacterium sp.]|uniref:Mu transposase C-terminal domain-containing protein n=1 Tax=Aquabacterium sp. TaxID=1872578 RepID=UPI0027240B95|nr:Mu transposase C-terminal domain-containing protein [Aquabacterium sp.]MDO9006078.1 DDE-type integrase/transposase/recombinase [Aquabacterium sp.]